MVVYYKCIDVQIYLHHMMWAGQKVRVMRLCLVFGFVMMSLMSGLVRFGLRYNHWVDVAVGFGIGIIMAVYIVSQLFCIFALGRSDS